MQTFLPYVNDFRSSAIVLDNKRLNKQLLEGRQIFAALLGLTKGWVNHPATRMWKNHETYLFEYLLAIKDECSKRGIKTDKNWFAIQEMYDEYFADNRNFDPPVWMSNEEIASKIEITHRANLYLKDPEYYEGFDYAVDTYRENVCCERCNYFWVTHKLWNNEEV